MDRQKGLRRTRTDQTMVTQFRKTPHDSGRCLLILITLHYVSHSLILQKTKTLVVGGYISTLDYRKIHFECIVGVGSVALGNCAISWRHGLPRYLGCVGLPTQILCLSISRAAKYENSGCRGEKCICLRFKDETRAPFNMWLRCVKFCFWLAPIRSGRSRHFPFFLQKFANSGCTN